MKLTLQIVAFVALLAVIYLIIMNCGETLSIQVAAPHYDAISETTIHPTKNLNFAFYSIMILGIGIFSGLCLLIPFYLTQTEQLYAYKRELEKSTVMTDNSTSQVKVLQAKIQVLEKALKEALDNNLLD